MEKQERYKEAKKRVGQIKGFYAHLFSYIGVNIVLLAIDLTTRPFELWFYWVTVFWGIGVFWHAMAVFAFGKINSKIWEKRKIKETMKKMEGGK